MDSLSSTTYFQQVYRINLIIPSIVTTSDPLSTETYYIQDPPLSFTRPIIPYTNTIIPTSIAPIVGDSRLEVRYGLVDSTLTKPTWLTYDLDVSKRIGTIYTTDLSLEATYPL
jgi:hypothetical protein